jgi:hypothetical protein
LSSNKPNQTNSCSQFYYNFFSKLPSIRKYYSWLSIIYLEKSLAADLISLFFTIRFIQSSRGLCLTNSTDISPNQSLCTQNSLSHTLYQQTNQNQNSLPFNYKYINNQKFCFFIFLIIFGFSTGFLNYKYKLKR